MDEEIKKLLADLKMEDVTKELEQPELCHKQVEATPQELPKKSFFSKKRLFIASVIACACVASTFTLQKESQEAVPVEALIAENTAPQAALSEPVSWVESITAQDPEIGQNVRALLASLQSRKQGLEEINKELTTILDKNALAHQDFFAAQANTVLSRYHALDARYSFEIAHQMNLINRALRKKQNPQLEQACMELFRELNCLTYTSYQQQIAKELVTAEFSWQDAIQEVEETESIQDLQAAVAQASKIIEGFQNNGFMQTFLNLEELQKELPPAVAACLNMILFESDEIAAADFDSESRNELLAILAEIGASSEDKSRYIERFDLLAKQAEAQMASKAKFHQLLRNSLPGH